MTFLGIGLSLALREGLSKAGAVTLLPRLTLSGLAAIAVLGPIFFTNQSVVVYLSYLLAPAAWFYINRIKQSIVY